jgi:hypothetical protein
MVASVFSGLVALAALAGFALGVAWVRRCPPVGIALIGLILIPILGRPQFASPIVTLSGASLYFSDVVTLLLFVTGLLQVRQLRANLRAWFVPWVLFGALIAFALLRAVVSDGPASGVNSARWVLYFFWAMTWVLGIHPDRLRLHTVSLVFGWALALVAMYHGLKYGFGGASSKIFIGDGIVRNGRVHNAAQSIVLLLCAATVFLGPVGSARSRRRSDVFSALVFAGVVVIAQHRSVWAAGALGMAAVLIWSARSKARKQVFAQLLLAAGVIVVAGYSGMLGGSQISESASNTQTYQWRSSGWRILVPQAIARGPATVMLGDPSASTYSRRLAGGVDTSVSAHNWYLDVFLYLGFLGLILLFAMLVSAVVKSRETSAAWTFVLAAVATYGWAYSPEWFLAPWLGVAIVASLGAGRIAEDSFPTSGLVVKANAERVGAGYAHRS